MISVFLREQKRYTQEDLVNEFRCSEEKTVRILKRLKEYGVLKAVKANDTQKDLTDLVDEDIEIADVEVGENEYLYVFTFVGVITIEGRVLKCYPKYLLDATAPKAELKQVLKVLEKYNSKEQIIRMYNDTSDSSAFNMLAVTMSINQIAKRDGITTKEAYKKYGISVFRTTNAQSSIRTRIIDYKKEMGIDCQYLSIEYVPKTGKNRGKVYEQFYKDDICNLFVWLRDTSEVIDGELYKKDLQGTYWDMNAWMKNVAREGAVDFPQSKKPEKLIQQIIEMCTQPGDLVLDSFLGSGTTAAVAHKLGRRYIGVEMGDHAYSLCKPRLDSIISGTDNSGITKSAEWNGGGGYRFFELAPTLINRDPFDEYVINEEYDADMLAAAVALHEGFSYQPDSGLFWKQSVGNEGSYLFVTTRHLITARSAGKNRSLIWAQRRSSCLRITLPCSMRRRRRKRGRSLLRRSRTLTV